MSIFNTNPDPDYPVLNGPGFIQATYQQYNNPYMQAAGAQQYYYNGQYLQPMYQPMHQPGFPVDSRRYDAPTTPIPTQQPQQTFGFNQFAESRRNQVNPPVTSPWAVQTIQQPQPVMPVMQPQQFAAPQTQVTTVTYPSAYLTTNNPYPALTTCHPSIDKTNAWGDPKVYNPMPAPMVNWGNVGMQPVQVAPQQCGYALQTMTYPQPVMTQPIQQNWEEIAKQNFPK